MTTQNPYEAPRAPVHAAPPQAYFAPMEPPPTGLARVVALLLAGTIPLSLLSIWASLDRVGVLKASLGGDLDLAAAEASDVLVATVAILNLVYFLVTAITYLTWLARACRVARARAPGVVTTTPGWAVGWFFIPIANLFKPYQVMREIWEASAADERGPAATPAIFPLWWAAWIITGISGQISFRLAMRADDAETLLTSTQVDIASDAVDIVAAALAILVVAAIRGAQARNCQPLAR